MTGRTSRREAPRQSSVARASPKILLRWSGSIARRQFTSVRRARRTECASSRTSRGCRAAEAAICIRASRSVRDRNQRSLAPKDDRWRDRRRTSDGRCRGAGGWIQSLEFSVDAVGVRVRIATSSRGSRHSHGASGRSRTRPRSKRSRKTHRAAKRGPHRAQRSFRRAQDTRSTVGCRRCLLFDRSG